jgi:hypothetical protein
MYHKAPIFVGHRFSGHTNLAKSARLHGLPENGRAELQSLCDGQGSVQLRRGSPRIYAGERGLQPARKIPATKTSGFSRGGSEFRVLTQTLQPRRKSYRYFRALALEARFLFFPQTVQPLKYEFCSSHKYA